MKKCQIFGVAFDLEGPFADLERFHFHLGFIPAARDLGFSIDFATIRTIPHAIGGGDQVIAEGISRLSDGKIDPVVLRAAKMEHYNRAIEHEPMIPRPGVLAVIDWIKKKGLPIAISSLTPRSQAVTILERSGAYDIFKKENIVLLEDVENKKPAPDVYLASARKMGIDPKHQLAFEDSATGVKAAVAAGSRAVAMPIFREVDTLTDLVKAGARRIFMDWREINISSLFENLEEED